MNRVVAAILIALGALLLTPVVFAIAVLAATPGGSTVAIVNPAALIALVLVPITGLALIWAGLRGLKPR